MKIRITSIAVTEVGELVSSVTTALEDKVQPFIKDKYYGGGIKQFVVFFVSVDSDAIQNERYCISNNRASRYKDLVTGEMIKYVGIAIPVSPDLLLSSSPTQLPKLFENLLLEELKLPAYAMPKNFERESLLTDIQAVFLTNT